MGRGKGSNGLRSEQILSGEGGGGAQPEGCERWGISSCFVYLYIPHCLQQSLWGRS